MSGAREDGTVTEVEKGPDSEPLPRWRLTKVYAVTVRVLLSYAWLKVRAAVLGSAWREGQLAFCHRRNAARIREAILEVQGLFIKIGQGISILSNFLPADFRDQLQSLQDRIPPRPLREIRARLRQELGGEIEELFSEFERVPIASASLAQVHAARLADGRRVAVKVQHLNIEVLAKRDLAALRNVLRLVEIAVGVRGLTAVFQELRAMILDELDFAKEADYAQQIAAAFVADAGVSVPAVVRECSTTRLLTMEFMDGVKVSDLEGLAALGVDRRAVAERIVGAYCKMLFREGVFHADPHPGNILVRADGGIVLLDFGAVARLSPGMQAGIPQFLEAVLRRDQAKILESLGLMGFVQRRGDSGEANRVAERVIDAIYSRFLGGIDLSTWNLSELRFDPRAKLDLMVDLGRLDISLADINATFRIPREWLLLERTALLLAGLCTHLDSTMRPLAVIRPYLEEYVLGNKDWVGVVATTLKDMVGSALAVPESLRQVLAKARRGELRVQVGGLEPAVAVVYAVGHQLLFGLLALGLGTLALFAQERAIANLPQILAAAAAFFSVCLAGSLMRTRKWMRRLRAQTRE
jgi:ubiquinone biosynthesis protein